MITDRDRDIINFVNSIGFASIKNISDMFFTDCRYGYDLARKRLKKIYDCGRYIKKFINVETNEIVYIPIDSKVKNVSVHSMRVLEYVCKLKGLGCDITEVEFEPVFGGIKPDAYISFKFNGYIYFELLEIQLRHDYVNISKFKKEDTINAILDRTNDVYPKLVIVQDTKKDYNKDNDSDFEIVQLDLSMNDIAKVLM